MTLSPFLKLSPEVTGALAANRPLVALESTIISHGMPWPHNLETALALEADVRAEGAVPATVGIVEGRLKAGLSRHDIERFARDGAAVAKVSRRDLPIAVARRSNGATTVAATMIVAALAGIPVFATGGIGGVHRGAEESFDISADLEELAKTPVAVVCAGAKSILDIGKTLEVLETNGVPVLGYRTEDFPAFWARKSGHKVDHRVEDAETAARIVALQGDLGMGGVLIANPIPEADALKSDFIEAEIEKALADAEAQKVTRKDLTPFLLQRIFELTGGTSLKANIALVENNAAVAAEIAVALARLTAPKLQAQARRA